MKRAPRATSARWLTLRNAAGGALLLVLLTCASAAGVLAPGDPLRPAGPPLRPPGQIYLLGTDDLGRDVLAVLIHGSRLSLLVGGLAAFTSGVLGTLVGGVAGFIGGRTDDLLMRLTEAVQVVPRFFLALIVATLFGPSALMIALLLGLTFWPTSARLLRAQILSVRAREYVAGARAAGATETRIFLRHVLPNSISVVVVSTALQVGAAILVEAGLGFLGLGDRSVVSWGNQLNGAQPVIRIAWWAAVFPGLAITLTVVGANLVADSLNDALDPRARTSSR
ncbi:MAG: ABC transporter permease [Chloroflexota bacterium]